MRSGQRDCVINDSYFVMGTPTFFAARLPERECSQRFRKMPTRLHITLSEVVQVAGSPLKENSLWALLRLASEAVQVASAGTTSPTPIFRHQHTHCSR